MRSPADGGPGFQVVFARARAYLARHDVAGSNVGRQKVPVSPPDTLERVKALADEVICLHAPEFFGDAGRFYENFDAVPDDEVIDRLRDPLPARKRPA
jgi:predicted phosphoribosyltransferase